LSGIAGEWDVTLSDSFDDIRGRYAEGVLVGVWRLFGTAADC